MVDPPMLNANMLHWMTNRKNAFICVPVSLYNVINKIPTQFFIVYQLVINPIKE